MNSSPRTPFSTDFISWPPCPAHDSAKRVLLVEEDSSARWMVRNALRNECDFMTAATGEQALDIYLKCMPEVVFLDFNLPGRKGDDILRMILDKDPGAFVVVMSGPEDIEALLDMMNMGAKGIITKPYGKAEIMNYLINSPTLR